MRYGSSRGREGGGAGKRGDLLLLARLPQAVQQTGDAVRVVEGGVRGRIPGQQSVDLLLRARLPQLAQQAGDAVRVAEFEATSTVTHWAARWSPGWTWCKIRIRFAPARGSPRAAAFLWRLGGVPVEAASAGNGGEGGRSARWAHRAAAQKLGGGIRACRWRRPYWSR